MLNMATRLPPLKMKPFSVSLSWLARSDVSDPLNPDA